MSPEATPSDVSACDPREVRRPRNTRTIASYSQGVLSSVPRVLLAPRGDGILPLTEVDVSGLPIRGTVTGISRQLDWELCAWADRSREIPQHRLEFLVQAHLLAADLQVELGLGVTVLTFESDVRLRGVSRSREDREADAVWCKQTPASRLKRFPRLGGAATRFRAPEVLPRVQPDENGDRGRRVVLSEEWIADFPVWGYDLPGAPGWAGMLSSSLLPVDHDLVRRLREWNQTWETRNAWVLEDRVDGTTCLPERRPDDYETELAHVVTGHGLAAELQAACGPEILVFYPRPNS